MSESQQPQAPAIVTVEGKSYYINDLTPQGRQCLQQLADIQRRMAPLSLEIGQLAAAQTVFEKELRKSLMDVEPITQKEPNPETPPPPAE